MIRSRYALCANRVIRDAEENRISVIDVLEDINVPAFPLVFPRLTLTLGASRDAADGEDYEGTIILRLNDQILMETQLTLNFQGSLSTRTTTVIGGLALQAPGVFSVTWSIPDHLEARYEATIGSQPHVAVPEGPGGLIMG